MYIVILGWAIEIDAAVSTDCGSPQFRWNSLSSKSELYSNGPVNSRGSAPTEFRSEFGRKRSKSRLLMVWPSAPRFWPQIGRGPAENYFRPNSDRFPIGLRLEKAEFFPASVADQRRWRANSSRQPTGIRPDVVSGHSLDGCRSDCSRRRPEITPPVPPARGVDGANSDRRQPQSDRQPAGE